MRVKIEQIDCTGSGLCELSVPAVFTLDDDGLAIVRSDGPMAPADVDADGAIIPDEFLSDVRSAAAACPGACILCTEP
jgi:ferredoxin